MPDPLSLTHLLAQFAPAPAGPSADPAESAHTPPEFSAESAAAALIAADSLSEPAGESLAERIRSEKAEVLAALEAGRVFLRNRSGDGPATIHDADCPTVEHRVNRDRAWSYVRAFPGPLAHPERLPGWAVRLPGHEGEDALARPAAMPELLDRARVEALRRFRRCGTCLPELSEPVLPPGTAIVQLRNLSEQHLGRSLRTPEGEELGELLEVVVTLRFAGGERRGAPGDRVLIAPE